MARKVAAKETVKEVGIPPKAEKQQIEYVDPKTLKFADYNPRQITPAQLDAVCRSIVEFGIVDPIIARREDSLVIGGHQRLKAIQKLVAGPFVYKGKDGKKVTVKWEQPSEGIPVIFLAGVSDARAKMLNLALNRAGGDWEEDMLANMMKSLNDGGLDMFELGVTAFDQSEIADYIDIAGELEKGNANFDDGQMPGPSKQVPKLTLEFTSVELRDAVKAAVSAQAQKNEAAGETLARMLNVKAKKARRAAA
jgi:hypothetical protein